MANLNQVHRSPDFDNILRVLKREKPSRRTLFEYFMNENVYNEVAGIYPDNATLTDYFKYMIKAYSECGYDYVNLAGSEFNFNSGAHATKSTLSLNEKSLIFDWDSFYNFPWVKADKCDYSGLEIIEKLLVGNMKVMVSGPGGVLENVIDIVGYDNLCIMIYENPELVQAIFDKIGGEIVKYYQRSAQYNSVGMIMSNDDWGFNTQTMLSPSDMRKYVFPWHKKIVECVHKQGKPVVLHSCGYMGEIMEDIIEDMKYDAKHSFEDNIFSVEDSYKLWGKRIAILGGIDLDFLIRRPECEIVARANKLFELAEENGGYALGSGNSIPSYVPNEKYFAMTATVL